MLFGTEGKLVKIRAVENLRLAEHRRLLREARASRAAALRRNRLWRLSRIGGLVIMLRERIRRIVLKQAHLTVVEATREEYDD